MKTLRSERRLGVHPCVYRTTWHVHGRVRVSQLCPVPLESHRVKQAGQTQLEVRLEAGDMRGGGVGTGKPLRGRGSLVLPTGHLYPAWPGPSREGENQIT